MNSIACNKESETEDEQELNQGHLCDNCYEDGIYSHDVYLALGLNHDNKNN